MAEVPLKSLERYDVLDRIAVGGMAEVFLAKAYGAHGFEKTLAIKRILPELARDPEFEERFIAEAKVAVRLSHTNVVQVFDFGRFAGSLFIAMEYVDGLDLAALLRKHKEIGRLLPVPAAFHIAVELARGLDFAHSHGVVHRDVSPSNILLSRAGEVKIADFGIAIAARMEKPKPGQKRKVMGKWRYMSPEQARGEPVDARSDIFSMAVVMYELLTGEKLFPGDEVEDIVRNINEMPLPRPSEIRRDLPKRVDDILLPALSREPGRRPARASLLQRAITELSYESSIVSTALDVADAVSSAVDIVTAGSTSGKHSLDSIVRAQVADNLGKVDGGTRRTALTTDQRSTAITASKLYRERGEPLVITREAIMLGTAVTDPAPDDDSQVEEERGRITEPVNLENLGDDTTSRAMLERRVDPDGITHLELDTTTIGAIPRNRPPTLPPPPVPVPVPVPVPARSRMPAVLVTLAALAAAAVALFLATRSSSTPAAAAIDAGRVALPLDANPAPGVVTLEIETEPPGATGTAGDVAIPSTPSSVRIPAGKTVTVRLDHPGYRTWTDRVSGDPGQVVRIRAPLIAARAALHISTTPSGATVTLGGKVIGETPLDRDDLEPAHGVDLVIARNGYDPIHTRVDLSLDKAATLHEDLHAVQRFGTIDLFIDDGWAEVYLKGKLLGRAPVKGLKLPVGHQKLVLINPPSKKQTTLDVDVVDTETRYYRTHFQ